MTEALSDLKVEISEVQPCVKKLIIEVSANAIAGEAEKKFKEIGKTAQVQGFRKGRVPKPILKKMYSKSILWDVSQRLISSSYETVLNEHKLTVYGEPTIEDVKIDEGKPLSYTATIETLPEVELPDRSKWEFTREISKVDDSMVEEVINNFREQNAELLPVEDRGIKDEDHVYLDYTGTVDGKVQENISGKNRRLLVSSKKDNILADFHKEIEGLKPGDEKEFTLTLSKQFPDPALAGKTASFRVKVNSIKEKKIPEITDEMVASSTPYKKVEEMRAGVRENMETGMRTDADRRLRVDILDRIIEETSFDLPPKMIASYTEHCANTALAESNRYGVDLESSPNFNKDDFQKVNREKAERMAREELIIEAIAQKENVTPERKEVLEKCAEYEKILQSGGDHGDAQNVKRKALNAAFREELNEKTYKKLLSTVQITEKSVDKEETGKKEKTKKQNKESA